MDDRAEAFMAAAVALGRYEAEMAEEWLRLVGTGLNGFEATKRVDLNFAVFHRMRLAEYEVTLVKLKKGACSCP